MLRPVSSALPLPGTSDAWPHDFRAEDLARLIDGSLLGLVHSTRPQICRTGLDFTARDHLGLAGHPALRAAAHADDGRNPTEQDLNQPPQPAPHPMLEAYLAAALKLPHAVIFGTGSDATRHTLSAILSQEDDVLVDSGASSAMVEAIQRAKAHLHRFPSGSVEAVERRLTRLARQPRRGRLVIAVPAVSDLASKVADLAELTLLARHHDALLVVDVSRDLGSMGQDGGGILEVQGCLGRVDVAFGSLANGFGVDGGFAAFRDPDLEQPLRHATTHLSSVNARVILAAARIAFSPEGQRRRRHLHGISLRLRNHLMADGARVMGQASPVVPVLLPPTTALPRTALLESAGPRVPLLQAPIVPLHAPRWRIQLNALHGPADIDDLAELIRDVSRAFDRSPARLREAV